MKPLNRF